MTVLFNIMAVSVSLAQVDLCGEPLCFYYTSEVVSCQSKVISAFAFNANHGRESLLRFPCTGEDEQMRNSFLSQSRVCRGQCYPEIHRRAFFMLYFSCLV